MFVPVVGLFTIVQFSFTYSQTVFIGYFYFFFFFFKKMAGLVLGFQSYSP